MSASKGSHSAKDHTDRTKQYVVAGVIIAIIIAALLIWNSGIFQKNATAATIGDQKINVAELDYYYNSVANNFINNANAYSQYGIDTGYNINLSPEEQYYNAESKTTYAKYFMDTALEQLQRVTILKDQAKEANYSLSDEGKTQVDAALNQLTMYSVQSGYSKDAYLHMIYGKHMSLGLYKDMVKDAVLADEFAAWKADQFTYTDEQFTAYYDENKNDLDTYDYRYCYVYSDTEPTYDADGKEVEPTEEETAAALADAGRKANQMANRVRRGESFNKVAQDFANEETAAKYAADENYSHNTDTMGSSLSSAFADWLKDTARTSGEVTALESDQGYVVVQFLGRAQRNDLYETVDLRSILITAETTPTEVETGTDETTGQPVKETVDRASEEQLATAKTKAEEVLAKYNGGETTADAFGTLAKEFSDDTATKDTNGVMTGVTRSDLSSAASTWAFAAGQEIGSTTIVEVTDKDGNVTGYQILFLEGVGLPRWEFAAKAALSSDDYNDWYDAFLEQYSIDYVGTPLKDKVANGEDANGQNDTNEPTDGGNAPTDNGAEPTNPNGENAGQGDNDGKDAPTANNDTPPDNAGDNADQNDNAE